jgi:hypothetical protein
VQIGSAVTFLDAFVSITRSASLKHTAAVQDLTADRLIRPGGVQIRRFDHHFFRARRRDQDLLTEPLAEGARCRTPEIFGRNTRAGTGFSRLLEKTSVEPGPFGYAIFFHTPNR